jgi:hypothetical protein
VQFQNGGQFVLYVDIPTLPEFKALVAIRDELCVSFYLPTTPLTQDAEADRIGLKNSMKVATEQLLGNDADKRKVAAIDEQVADLIDDDEFWRFQANSLAVLVTPDTLRTFRMPNRLRSFVEVSDRFHLNPLLRAVTFPHEAFVLALSQGTVRLVQVFADLAPHWRHLSGTSRF